MWRALLIGPHLATPIEVELLADDGSHLVLICRDLFEHLGLHLKRLHKPEVFGVAFNSAGSSSCSSSHFVCLKLSDPYGCWTSHTVWAVVVDSLCIPMILGLLFLAYNSLICDLKFSSIIHRPSGFDLLHPDISPVPRPVPPIVSPPVACHTLAQEACCSNLDAAGWQYSIMKSYSAML
ncbi:reverse transcriptase-rnase h-integrase, partial [Moniliophthora roreri MCA 2997]